MPKKKVIDLNRITRVEIYQSDIAVIQEDSMVIIDHEEIEKLYKVLQDRKRILN
jgi:hypothetical protein